MAEKKKFPISIGFNLKDVKRDLEETKEILKEKERLESSGALPKSITSKQDKNKNQRSQQHGGRGLYKDTKSKSSTSGIVPENIIAQQQSQIRELQQKQKESEKKQKEYSKEQVRIKKDEKKERSEEYKKFMDEIKAQKEHDKLVDRQVNEMQETMLNPFFALRKRGAQALKAIIPLALIAEVAELVLTRIQKEFGPGGRLDLRKLVLNIVTEFLQIPQRIQRDRGEVFFSSGYNSPLYQGAPGISNTERLADGHLRDILIDPGR